MWEMLAGRPPFESESPRILLDKLCTEPAPPLPDAARRGLPRGVEQLIVQLLEKDPEARPSGADEVLERLDPFRPAELSTGTRPGRTGSNERTAASERASKDEPAVVSPAASSKPASRPATNERELAPKRLDTVALVERAAAPRDIPPKLALTIIVSLSLAAGLVTWLIRLLSV
jgi:serine/threonine-protein kinase